MLVYGDMVAKKSNDPLEQYIGRRNMLVLAPAKLIVPEAESEELTQLCNKATTALRSILNDHAETPWAAQAQRELDRGFGWQWNQ